MQTRTLVRFLHIVASVFFVGGQLMLVAAVGPAIRKRGDEQTMRLIARHFGIGSVAALAVVVATGVAMASHFSLWHSDILRFKLAALVLVAVLLALHVLTPTSRGVSYGVAAGSLLVAWLGVKLIYGRRIAWQGSRAGSGR